MATIKVENGILTVEIEGFDRVWSMRSHLQVPIEHVAGARIDPEAARAASGSGLKLGGARFGHHLTAGTFRQHGEWVFWDVHDFDKSVIVDLHDDQYGRLVIEVDDSTAAVAAITQAITTPPRS